MHGSRLEDSKILLWGGNKEDISHDRKDNGINGRRREFFRLSCLLLRNNSLAPPTYLSSGKGTKGTDDQEKQYWPGSKIAASNNRY